MSPVVDIIIKSYPPDYEWLKYCLRSIHKFARGFRQTVVLLPHTSPLPLTLEKMVLVEHEETYLTQQMAKMHADHHTDAEFFWHLDSDCLLTREVTPADFMKDDKALWLITPWKDCFESKRAWFHVMCKCLQEAPEHEFMRRHGQLIPRFAYGAFRQFIQDTHGVSMDAYIVNQPRNEYSEFNCIGFYLWLHHRDTIAWHDTSIDGIPPCPIEQAWSWSETGITQEHRNRMEVLLA